MHERLSSEIYFMFVEVIYVVYLFRVCVCSWFVLRFTFGVVSYDSAAFAVHYLRSVYSE